MVAYYTTTILHPLCIVGLNLCSNENGHRDIECAETERLHGGTDKTH